LVTDLDGTLIGHRDDRELYPQFKAMLDEWRQAGNLQWIICTGRSFIGSRTFFGSMERRDIYPDVVVTRRGAVYACAGKRYRIQPVDSAWVWLGLWRSHVQARRLIKHMHHHLRTTIRGVGRVLKLPDRFILRFADEATATKAMAWVKHAMRNAPALKARQQDREVEVYQVDGSDGVAIRVLSDRRGVSRDEILAIGDSVGNLSMLDHRVAFYTGCPINADDETRLGVRAMRGHVSTQFTLAGVMDVVRATLAGNVSSEIPAELPEMPRQRRSHGGGMRRSGSIARQHVVRSYMTLGTIACVTLVVFAHFGLIPFSGAIMKPVHLVLRLIYEIFSLVMG
jgi:hydroxymethylpyrimidine pyrophosphatase-like HAD family hydrolase